MIVLKRKVTVSKKAEDVRSILKSCSYYIPKAVCEDADFSFYYPKRHTRQGMTLVPVKGMIERAADGTTISLEIHANPLFYVGCAVAVFGVCCLVRSLLMQTEGWFGSLLFMLMGGIFSGVYLCTGIEVLDLISHKLKR